MTTQSLRGLARAHSDKLIDRDEYMKGRRRLIDDIIAGQAEIVPYEPPPPMSREELEKTLDGESTLELPREEVESATVAAVETSQRPASRWPLIVLIIVVLGAVAVFLWSGPVQSAHVSAASRPAEPAMVASRDTPISPWI